MKSTLISKPGPAGLNPYYRSYLKYVEDTDMIGLLAKAHVDTQDFLASVTETQAGNAYQPGKWLLKEVVGHMCDAERILTYRALCISRNDKTHFPGFDENAYTPASNYSSRSLKNIADEFSAVRNSTIHLFRNMDIEMFERRGMANDCEVTVRHLLFFVLAHEQHHLGVIRERYLS